MFAFINNRFSFCLSWYSIYICNPIFIILKFKAIDFLYRCSFNCLPSLSSPDSYFSYYINKSYRFFITLLKNDFYKTIVLHWDNYECAVYQFIILKIHIIKFEISITYKFIHLFHLNYFLFYYLYNKSIIQNIFKITKHQDEVHFLSKGVHQSTVYDQFKVNSM